MSNYIPQNREHWLISAARSLPPTPESRAQLAFQLVGALREVNATRGVVTRYVELLIAHREAEEIMDARITEHYAPIVKPDPKPEKPEKPAKQTPPDGVTRVFLPGRSCPPPPRAELGPIVLRN